MTKEVSFAASFDSWVDEAVPDKNHGDGGYLKMMAGAGVRRRIFLHFPVASTLHGKYIISAQLKFVNKGTWSSVPLNVQRVTQRWKESTVTWNNQPNASATSYGFTLSGVDRQVQAISLLNIVQQWADGSAAYGLMLTTSATSSQNMFASESGKPTRPRLVVQYASTPDAPTKLRPSDGIAVSDAAPRFNWSSDTPTQTQVQISTVNTFVSTVYDSGQVANTTNQWDTAANASPPALTDNTTYYWRVRIWDENGIPSDWSNAAQFQRRSFGSLNITAPTSTVFDTTPVISHTFSGRTQQATYYELYETRASGVTNLIWTRDWLNTTSTNLTLPENLITKATSTYTVLLRVRDTFQRRANEYVEDTQSFTWTKDNTVTPVSNLAATTVDGHVELTWTRASAPDYYAVLIDGVVQDARILPSDVSLGGTNYKYKSYTSKPRSSHTYVVEAVTTSAGVQHHSQSNPSVSLTFSPSGIWLCDPDDLIETRIMGQDAATMTIGETSTTFYTVGNRAPVRIVDQVRGLEGSISGELLTYAGRTAATEKANLETMLGNPIATRRLVLGYRNIPVQIQNVSIASVPDTEEMYDVSFDFFQVDEWET